MSRKKEACGKRVMEMSMAQAKESNKKFQLAGVWATRAMDKTGKVLDHEVLK